MRVVIVGAGQAGAAAAAKLRALGHSGPITMIGEEPAPPYQRPPLSKAYLLGELPAERLWLRPTKFWDEHDVRLMLGAPATAIDRAAREVRVGDEVLPYDALVLATGSVPRRLSPGIGGGMAGSYPVRTLADIEAVRPEFVAGRRVVVLGGGYIGLEVASVASRLGLAVTVIQSAPRILRRVSAPESADYIRRLHQSHGVTILENTRVERLLGNGRVTAVRLEGGRELPADFVIEGIGITPATALAGTAGLVIDNGIATDEMGCTSDPAIWSAGDCTSFPFKGRRIRLEAVSNAIDQAEAVAANILGARTPYEAKPWFWSDQFDLRLQIAGLSRGYDRVVHRPGPDGAASFWYFAPGGELLAVDAMSDSRAYMIGKRLIDAGRSPLPDQVASVADLRELLQGHPR